MIERTYGLNVEEKAKNMKLGPIKLKRDRLFKPSEYILEDLKRKKTAEQFSFFHKYKTTHRETKALKLQRRMKEAERLYQTALQRRKIFTQKMMEDPPLDYRMNGMQSYFPENLLIPIKRLENGQSSNSGDTFLTEVDQQPEDKEVVPSRNEGENFDRLNEFSFLVKKRKKRRLNPLHVSTTNPVLNKAFERLPDVPKSKIPPLDSMQPSGHDPKTRSDLIPKKRRKKKTKNHLIPINPYELPKRTRPTEFISRYAPINEQSQNLPLQTQKMKIVKQKLQEKLKNNPGRNPEIIPNPELFPEINDTNRDDVEERAMTLTRINRPTPEPSLHIVNRFERTITV